MTKHTEFCAPLQKRTTQARSCQKNFEQRGLFLENGHAKANKVSALSLCQESLSIHRLFYVHNKNTLEIHTSTIVTLPGCAHVESLLVNGQAPQYWDWISSQIEVIRRFTNWYHIAYSSRMLAESHEFKKKKPKIHLQPKEPSKSLHQTADSATNKANNHHHKPDYPHDT